MTQAVTVIQTAQSKHLACPAVVCVYKHTLTNEDIMSDNDQEYIRVYISYCRCQLSQPIPAHLHPSVLIK